MKDNEFNQIGIKYKVFKLTDEKYILFPIDAKFGVETKEGFQTSDELIQNVKSKNNLTNSFVINNIYDCDELYYIYESYEVEMDFLRDCFFDDFKDIILFVSAKESEELKQVEINLNYLLDENLMYYMKNNVPTLALNEEALNNILESDDLNIIKNNLFRLKKLITSFKNMNEESDVLKVHVTHGHVNYMEVASFEMNDLIADGKPKRVIDESVTYDGLLKYLKERIIGHDEELSVFAQKMIMNYTALDDEDVESILFVGPTGTGKTETVKAASSYLNLPFISVNAANLVTQGIIGTSIENALTSLYEISGRNLDIAEHGIILLDEFDKLSHTNLDIKKPVKDILLTFNDGSSFIIENKHYNITFDSTHLIKVYGGVFDKIYIDKKIGFNAENTSFKELDSTEIRQKIIQAGYFTEEELDRISTLLKYNKLDRESKRRILLESKLSILKKKIERYKRQFNTELIATNEYIDEILDKAEKKGSMRNLNNLVRESLNDIEKYLLTSGKKVKKIRLTRDTAINSKKFDS